MILKTKRWRCWFSDLDSEKACRLFDAKIITANEWITEDDIAKSLHLLPFTLSTLHDAAQSNRIHLIEFNDGHTKEFNIHPTKYLRLLKNGLKKILAG